MAWTGPPRKTQPEPATLRQRCLKLAASRPSFAALTELVEAAQKNQQQLCVSLIEDVLAAVKRGEGTQALASVLTQIILLLRGTRCDVDAGVA